MKSTQKTKKTKISNNSKKTIKFVPMKQKQRKRLTDAELIEKYGGKEGESKAIALTKKVLSPSTSSSAKSVKSKK